MSLTETKKEFHQLIDSIEDQQMLNKMFDTVLRTASKEEGQLWNTLSVSEKDEVLNAYYESLSEENLISHEDMMKKFEKWLSK